MYKEVEEDSSLAASCRKDYLTLENLYRNFDSAVSRYTPECDKTRNFRRVRVREFGARGLDFPFIMRDD